MMMYSARHWRLFRDGAPPSSPAAAPPRSAARGLTAAPRHEADTDAGPWRGLAIIEAGNQVSLSDRMVSHAKGSLQVSGGGNIMFTAIRWNEWFLAPWRPGVSSSIGNRREPASHGSMIVGTSTRNR